MAEGRRKRIGKGTGKEILPPFTLLSYSLVHGEAWGKQQVLYVASPPSAPVFGMTVEHWWILIAATGERRQDAEEHPVLAEVGHGGLCWVVWCRGWPEKGDYAVNDPHETS
jgi:hypothetical protein